MLEKLSGLATSRTVQPPREGKKFSPGIKASGVEDLYPKGNEGMSMRFIANSEFCHTLQNQSKSSL